MENVTSPIIELLTYLHQTGGKIPIEVTSTVSSNWSQFYSNFAIALVGSFFMILFLYNSMLAPTVSALVIKLKLRAIKNKTGRNMLIIKHTSSGMFDMSMINQRTMTDISKALSKFDGKPFDLILHTPGGEVFSSLFISRLLREYAGEIRVIVPHYAMSGGTLLALSGHQIYMSPTACLGPVDPQLGNLFRYGSARSWDKIVKLKGKRAEDQSISFAHTGAQYTKYIAGYINELLIDKMDAQHRAQFVKFLTAGDVEHAHPLTINRLNSLGLEVLPLDKEIAKQLNRVISSKMYEGVYSL